MELRLIKLFETILYRKFCENKFDMEQFSIWNTKVSDGGYDVEVIDSYLNNEGKWSGYKESKWVFISNEEILDTITYFMKDFHRIGHEQE